MALVNGDGIGHRTRKQLALVDEHSNRDDSGNARERGRGERRPAVGCEREIGDDGNDGGDERAT